MATPTPTSPQDQNVSTANLIGTTLGNTIRRNPEGSAAVIQTGNVLIGPNALQRIPKLELVMI